MRHSIYRLVLGSAILGILIAPTTGIAQAASGGMAHPSSPSSSAPAAKPDPELEKKVMDGLRQCQQLSHTCNSTTKSAEGILVFPNVVKADFLIGGAGGKGALIEKGKITGYYSIGGASAGLQIGVETSSQLYVFRTPEALAELKKEGTAWKAGARGGVTLVAADANASSVTGDVLVYIYDAKGLHGGVSVDAFSVWKTGEKRPQ
jgi:lipid-binding SYLF domain-containing protein